MTEIENQLQNYGFARVMVIPKDSSLESSKIEEQFLDKPPEGLGLSKKRKLPPYRHFKRLGLYVGYVDKAQLKKMMTVAKNASIHAEEIISLIRPVEKRIAMSAGDMTWGLEKLGIQHFWNDGITGKNIKVGLLDTGVDGKHEALRGRIRDFIDVDYDGNIVHDTRDVEQKARDSDEHGTHCAGTICGGYSNGMSIGVAPGADLYAGLVIEGGDVLLRVLQGMEWCLEKNVKVLSMSLGLRGWVPFWWEVTKRIRESGILPVFAIGNEGEGTSRSPGNYPECISVGAIDSNERIASFSSSVKFDRPIEPNQPNCVAPGVNVISARPGGGVQEMSGTSMATPHAAGVCALLFEAKKDASIDEIEKAIFDTCKPLETGVPIHYGYGLIDPYRAYQKLTKK